MAMKRAFACCCLIILSIVGFPHRCPAPLIFTPGEGWRYEPVGSTTGWQKGRAKDQLDVAQQAFERKDYGLALKAARRLVNRWPFSDYTAQGRYLMARCHEARGQDEKAFNSYQRLVERHPTLPNYDEVVTRQYGIANRFLAGQWFKLWNYIPTFPSMSKTIQMYEKIIKNGPYSPVAPFAQMNIGEANEKKFFQDYAAAANAYERAADRYSDQPVGVDALFKQGLAYNKQAKTAEYDQSVAARAIATFTDFIALHPQDPRVTQAQEYISALKGEQARGSFDIARFYEKKSRWKGAKIYYNEVLANDPGGRYADAARQRIDAINRKEARQ